MISTAKTYKRSRGFTLLEVVVALAIASLLVGGAVGVMVVSSDERALKKAASEMELMAKRARATAILQQTPYALEFSQGAVRMMPWAQAALVDLPAGGEPVPVDSVTWELTLDNGMKAKLKRWNSDSWIAVEAGSVELWRFDPNGLSEPISVQLQIEESTATLDFNILTASIRDQEYDLR